MDSPQAGSPPCRDRHFLVFHQGGSRQDSPFSGVRYKYVVLAFDLVLELTSFFSGSEDEDDLSMAIDEDPTTPMPKKEKAKKEKKEEKKDEKKKGKDEEKDLSKEKDFLSDLPTDRNAARSKARVRSSTFRFLSPFSFAS